MAWPVLFFIPPYASQFSAAVTHVLFREIIQITLMIIKCSIHPSLDLVNMVVRPLLFTKLSLFTKSSLDKEKNMKKGAGVYSSNEVFH